MQTNFVLKWVESAFTRICWVPKLLTDAKSIKMLKRGNTLTGLNSSLTRTTAKQQELAHSRSGAGLGDLTPPTRCHTRLRRARQRPCARSNCIIYLWTRLQDVRVSKIYAGDSCTRTYSPHQSRAFRTCCIAHFLCPPGWDTDYIRKLIVWKIK